MSKQHPVRHVINNNNNNTNNNINHVRRRIKLILFISILFLLIMAFMSLNITLTRIPKLIYEFEQQLQQQLQQNQQITSSSSSRETIGKPKDYKNSSRHDKLKLRPQIQNKYRTSTRDSNKNQFNTVYKGDLNCDIYFNNNDIDHNIVQEMIYWKDIPSDDPIPVSPYYKGDGDNEQYLIFEPDESGWNNVRMAFETAIGMAIVMGRTLVLPPKLHFSRGWDEGWEDVPITVMGFEDYFDLMNHTNHIGLKIISFEDFLNNVALKGQLININTGIPSFPPFNNRTNWNGMIKNYERTINGYTKIIFEWLRSTAYPLKWDYGKCVAVFPSKANDNNLNKHLYDTLYEILNDEKKNNINWYTRLNTFKDNPISVNSTFKERLLEILGHRTQFCMYDEILQNAKVIHVYGEQNSGYRMLVHFYAFLLIEDYNVDLYIKRFIRDKLRYIDVIHCAAAKIVERVRTISKMYGQNDGSFDSMHVRRNDFKHFMKDIFLDANDLYETHTKNYIKEKRTIYISTDEKDLSYFNIFKQHYNIIFLTNIIDDIKHMIIPNFYGLVEELVATKGDTFIGTYYSTFSGYINRIRGYYANDIIYGGIPNTYYITTPSMGNNVKNIMQNYTPVEQSYWVREFPVCWRDIDHNILNKN